MKKVLAVGVFPTAVALISTIFLLGLSANPKGEIGIGSGRLVADRDEGGLDEGGRGTFYMTRHHFGQSAGQAAAAGPLAPDAIALQASLKSALERVKGLKAQAELPDASALSTSTAVSSLRDELSSDLRAANQSEASIRAQAGKVSGIAASKSYLDAQSALRSLIQAHTQWQAKAGQSQYWQSSDQVKKDLDGLKDQVNTAIDKNQDFSSERLGI